MGKLKGLLVAGFALGGLSSLAGILRGVVDTTKSAITEVEAFHQLAGVSVNSSLDTVMAAKARGVDPSTVSNAYGIFFKNIQSIRIEQEKQNIASAKAHSLGQAYTPVLGRQNRALQELFKTKQALAKYEAAKSPEEKLHLVIREFEGMKDNKSKETKTRLEKELFGKGGASMGPLLEAGNLGLTHQESLVKKYFGTFKGGQKGMEEFQEKQAEMKMAWEGIQFQMGQKLIPVFDKVLSWFTKIIPQIEHGKGIWGTFKNVLESTVGVLKSVWQFFEKNTWALKLLIGAMAIDKVLKFYKALKALEIVSVLASGFKALGVAFGFLDGGEMAGMIAGLWGIEAPLVAIEGTLAAIQALPIAAVLLGSYEAGKYLHDHHKGGTLAHHAFGSASIYGKNIQSRGSLSKEELSALGRYPMFHGHPAAGEQGKTEREQISTLLKDLPTGPKTIDGHKIELNIKNDIILDGQKVGETRSVVKGLENRQHTKSTGR